MEIHSVERRITLLSFFWQSDGFGFSRYMRTRAAKRLIAFKIKVYVYILHVCVLCIFFMYIYINTHIHVYIKEKYVRFIYKIFIFILYII